MSSDDWIDGKLGPPTVQVDGVAVGKRSIVNLKNGPLGTDLGASIGAAVDFAYVGPEPSRRRAPVRCAAVGSLAQYSRVGNVITMVDPGALSSFVFDGIAPAVGDRVLLPLDAVSWWGNASDAWIYNVTVAGDATHEAVLTRATDSDSSAEVYAGCAVRVREGTTLAGHEFVIANRHAITLNTTGILVVDTLDLERQKLYQGETTTTDGSTVVLFSVNVPDKHAGIFEANVIGIQDGGDHYYARKLVGAYRDGADAEVDGELVTEPNGERGREWDGSAGALSGQPTFDHSGQSLQIKVTGLAGHTIKWSGQGRWVALSQYK